MAVEGNQSAGEGGGGNAEADVIIGGEGAGGEGGAGAGVGAGGAGESAGAKDTKKASGTGEGAGGPGNEGAGKTPEQLKAEKDAADKKVADDKAKAETAKAEAEKARVEAEKSFGALKSPEGAEFDEATLGGFKKLALDSGLKADAAQKIVDYVAELDGKRTEAGVAQYRAQVKSLQDEIRNDKDFGGPKLKETVAQVNKLVSKFGDDDMRTALKKGLGNNPPLFRFLARLARADGNDSLAGSQNPGGGGSADAALTDILYPSMKQE